MTHAIAQGSLFDGAGGPTAVSRAIANSRGIPGTLGCFVSRKDDPHTYFLTNAHVLLGKNAVPGETVWSVVYEADGSYQCLALGTTVEARLGIAHHQGMPHFIDCAIGHVADVDLKKVKQPIRVQGTAVAQIGDRVYKTGASSGVTYGIVVDVCYPDTICIERKNYEAVNQILIAPAPGGGVFSHPGDSGSVVLNEKHQAVGLLWGSNGKGEGIASHLSPVLQALDVVIPSDRWSHVRALGSKFHKIFKNVISAS